MLMYWFLDRLWFPITVESLFDGWQLPGSANRWQCPFERGKNPLESLNDFQFKIIEPIHRGSNQCQVFDGWEFIEASE